MSGVLYRHYREQNIKHEPCPQCGVDTIAFTDDTDLRWRLELIPIDVDIGSLKRAQRCVFVLNDGGRWRSKFGMNRDWRPTAVEHHCTTQPIR